jgi:multidrug efflux pump subunit AcrA (membrane-fusion protein)
MKHLPILLGLVMAGTPAGAPAASADAGPSLTIPGCVVSFLDEAEVPAQEAGVLVELNVREGQEVSLDEVLAQIDAAQAEIAKRAADLQLKVAKEQAENDIRLQYAQAAAKVAEAEYIAALTINRDAPRTVPEVEVNRLKLVWEKTKWEIEQAREDMKISALEAKVREAELEHAQTQLTRRQIRSPLKGVVVELHRHAGEWVKPGDPVFHVGRMDRLRIKAFVKEADYAPSQIDGRQVSVEVELSGGRREEFPGQIVFVSPEVEGGGGYRVWAEVLNIREGRHWLLRSGQTVKMTIDLGSPQQPQQLGSLPIADHR